MFTRFWFCFLALLLFVVSVQNFSEVDALCIKGKFGGQEVDLKISLSDDDKEDKGQRGAIPVKTRLKRTTDLLFNSQDDMGHMLFQVKL